MAAGGILLMAKGPRNAPNAPGGRGQKRVPMGCLLPPEGKPEAAARAFQNLWFTFEAKYYQP